MTTTTTTSSAREQMLHDLLITAIEGGISYWAYVTSYDAAQGHATIIEAEEEDEGARAVDHKVMAKGYRLATTEWRDRIAWSTSKPPLVITSDTDWDYDAGDADVILQLGLFGEVVYG